MSNTKEYSIGFVSKLLNMSIEGVRNYEKADIIVAKRSDSAYRKFQYLDVTCMMRAKSYRAMGFSLKEIRDMINDTSIEDFCNSIKRKHSALLQENDLLRCKIAYMNEMIHALDEIVPLLNKPRIRMLPGYFRVEFSKNGVITQDEAVIETFSEWMNYMPFVHISSRYHGEDTYGGIAIRDDYASLFPIKESEIVHHIPGGLGIAMYMAEQGGHHTQSNVADKLRTYAQYHRYEISQDLIGHTIAAITKRTAYQRYREIHAIVLSETP